MRYDYFELHAQDDFLKPFPCSAIRDWFADTPPNSNVRFPEDSPGIASLGFSVRTVNCLSFKGIHTLDDLEQNTAVDLQVLRSFGAISLREVKRVLAKHGRHLRGEA